MADKTIRVSEETWEKLRSHKRGDLGESFDDVVARALDELEDDKWALYGALADTGISERMREVRTGFERELDADIEDATR